MNLVDIKGKLESSIKVLENRISSLIEQEEVLINSLNSLGKSISVKSSELDDIKSNYGNVLSQQKSELNKYHHDILQKCSRNEKEAERILVKEKNLNDDYKYQNDLLNSLIRDNKSKKKLLEFDKTKFNSEVRLFCRDKDNLETSLKEFNKLSSSLNKRENLIKDLETQCFKLYDDNRKEKQLYKEKNEELIKEKEEFEKSKQVILQDIANRELKLKDQFKQLLHAKNFIENEKRRTIK